MREEIEIWGIERNVRLRGKQQETKQGRLLEDTRHYGKTEQKPMKEWNGEK